MTCSKIKYALTTKWLFSLNPAKCIIGKTKILQQQLFCFKKFKKKIMKVSLHLCSNVWTPKQRRLFVNIYFNVL